MKKLCKKRKAISKEDFNQKVLSIYTEYFIANDSYEDICSLFLQIDNKFLQIRVNDAGIKCAYVNSFSTEEVYFDKEKNYGSIIRPLVVEWLNNVNLLEIIKTEDDYNEDYKVTLQFENHHRIDYFYSYEKDRAFLVIDDKLL